MFHIFENTSIRSQKGYILKLLLLLLDPVPMEEGHIK